MHRLLLTLAILMVGATLSAQTKRDDPYQRRYVELYGVYSQHPDDVSNLISLADFFAEAGNPQMNLPLAYGYIVRAEELYTERVQDKSRYREVQRLIKQGVSIGMLRQRKRDIEARAMAYVKAHLKEMRPYEAQAYAEAFPANQELVGALKSKMLADAFAQAKEENTMGGYYAFARQYPHTPQADSAEAALAEMAPRLFSHFATKEEIDSAAALYPESQSVQAAALQQQSHKAYAQVVRANTLEAYSAYMEQYPRGGHYVEALSNLEALRAAELQTLSTPEELADFVERHAADAMADSALAHLRRMVTDQRSQQAAQVYLSRFPLDEAYADVYRRYYGWYAEEGNRQPIEAFASSHPDYPFGLTVRSDLMRGSRIDSFDLTKRFVEADLDTMTSVVRLLTGRKVAFVALQRVLQQQIARKDWKSALERLRKFEICFEDVSSAEYEELASLLSERGAANASLLWTGDSISHVVPYPGGNRCYYVSHRQGGQTICYGHFTTGGRPAWKAEGTVRLTGGENGATLYCFYDEGRHALVGINGDIWSARIVSDSLWEVELHLPAPVNSAYVEQDAFMLEDGSGVLFVSDRPGGQNVQRSRSYYHGDYQLATDIYFVPFDGHQWGEAVNLGPEVNTPYCERSPILSRNMLSLYFITDARGLGYGDVYRTTRTDPNDWTHWSRPVNLGRGVNGAFDEVSIAFDGSEKQIFLTAESPTGEGCSVLAFATQHDTASAYRMVEVDFEPVDDVLRSVRLVDVARGQVVSRLSDRQVDSLYLFRLYKEVNYALLVETDWLYVPTLEIGRAGCGRQAVRGYTLEELKAMESPLALPLVVFYDGTSRILPMGEEELKVLSSFLLQRSAAKVNIQVRVRGADDRQSYALSLERAKAIRSYLVDCGVAASRLRVSAFGNMEYKQGKTPPEVSIRFE